LVGSDMEHNRTIMSNEAVHRELQGQSSSMRASISKLKIS
jgi:hypothetical protein